MIAKKHFRTIACPEVFYEVQEKRLELSWYCYHTDLNRARLPIPPFLLDKMYFI